MSKPSKPVFRLTLTPQGSTWLDHDDSTGTRRLKALLKAALRCFGLRAVEVAPEPAEPSCGNEAEFAIPIQQEGRKS